MKTKSTQQTSVNVVTLGCSKNLVDSEELMGQLKANDFDVKQLQHLTGIDAYDVIPLSTKTLLMIGKDGFYQFDTSNPNNLRQLSKIPVKRVDI